MSLPYETAGDPADIKGTSIPTEQPDSYRFVKGQGWTTVKAWEGPRKDGIFGKAEELRLGGFTNIDVRQQSPGVWRVEASVEGQGDGSTPEIADNWELYAVQSQTEIMTHPVVTKGTNTEAAFPENVIKSIIKTTDSPEEGVSPALTLPSDSSNQTQIYRLRLSGVKSFIRPEFILRNTRTIPSDDQIEGALSMDGIANIWLTADLPSVPDIIAGAISSIPNLGTPTGYLFGWLKMAPTLHTDVYGRAQVQLEWWLANWPTVLYAEY